MEQLGFFEPGPKYPEGFRYQPDVITRDQEQSLIAHIQTLPLKEFQFQGYTGKRRVMSFGWKYDWDDRRLHKVDDMPEFLLDAREAAARFAGTNTDQLQHALVTEYQPGAAIGWHRDRPEFGNVIGISLHAACTFRLRRKIGEKWERVNLTAEPRSAYLMSGPSRTEWEHSIPEVETLRYSITFRNLRDA